MNKALLKKHINKFLADPKRDPSKFERDLKERRDLVKYYQSYSSERILKMTQEDMYEYLSRLWAMLIWGNKHYLVDKIIEDNGFQEFKTQLSKLVWGSGDIADRWDAFRGAVKGMGPAMISEILCKTHPTEFMIWNRRACMGLRYLEVQGLPHYDYQLTGKVYAQLCDTCREIATQLDVVGIKDKSLLAVDYFIRDQLQIEDSPPGPPKPDETKFIHNDIRDKLRNIGQWLGFDASTEKKVSEGSRVDTVWESTIGNMGRVIYVFEVQTSGSIDSLILNLLKSLNNPAVQGVVAVSDNDQLEVIRRHAQDVKELRDKLKYWDYAEILKVHEYLEYTNSCINKLALVPQGF